MNEDLRSARSMRGQENADIRNVIKAMGYSDDDLAAGRPVIGIANSWNTLIPGHFNFKLLSEQVQKGIHRAGGTVFEFGTIGLCDAICKNDFNYVLPSREVICDSVEIMAGANPIDGLIMLASCDKIIPGMLMAAARLDIPAILLNGGPMLGGIRFGDRQADATSISEALGMYKTGKISLEEYENIEEHHGLPVRGPGYEPHRLRLHPGRPRRPPAPGRARRRGHLRSGQEGHHHPAGR